MSKKRWLWILVILLLLAFAAVVFFWESVSIYVMPKSVLSKALTEAMTDLQSLYEQSPVSMLVDYLDPEGQYTGQMDMDTKDKLLGPINYQMRVQADLSTNRLTAEGNIASSKNDLDLSVFLNRDFMALSSADLLGGAYYGVTYDTFREDIRSIPLLSMFVGEKVLSQWDSSVGDIQSAMNRSYKMPEIPEFSADDIQRAFMAVLLLPSHVERISMSVCGAEVPGYQISYSAKGEQVEDILGYLLAHGDGSDAQIHATFYVYENNLLMMHLNGEAGDSTIRCAIEFMAESPTTRTFRFSRREQGNENALALRYEFRHENGFLHENWTLFPDFDAKGEGKTFCYRWEPVMGEMVLDSADPVTLHIFETESGLNIQTDHFEKLIANVSDKTFAQDPEPIKCLLTLRNGSEITTPTYKNISQWSMEDFLVLLGGVGSLLGINLN